MSYDDEQIGRLVREAAEDWTMPPTQLDQQTWRDRVRRAPGSRRNLERWLRPITTAAGLAVVLLVVAAVVGVLLNTRPTPGPAAPTHAAVAPGPTGTQPRPALGTPTPEATRSSATPSQRPVTEGTLPSVKTALMELDDGRFGLLDLVSGSVKQVFDDGDFGSVARRSADGSIVCLCLRHSGYAALQPLSENVFLETASADGSLQEGTEVANYVGAADPRDGVAGVPMQPGNVAVAVTFAADPRYAYVGWSFREHPVWQSGVDVLDISTHQIVGTLDLPPITDGAGDTRRFTDAPRVVAAANGRMIVARPYFTWTPPASTAPVMTTGVDVFSAALNGLIPTSPKLLESASDCGDLVANAGIAADGRVWLACLANGASVTMRRLASDGSLIGDTSASTFNEGEGSTIVASADGAELYVWNPIERQLTRIDTSNGVADSVQAPDPSAGMADLLGQIGRWLVPPTQAKMFLRSGVALSPDGTKLYALGVTALDSSGGSASTGLYVIDLGKTLSIDRWAPAADLVSVAVSGDGKYVYTAAMPGFDTTGTPDYQPASVNVYDAATGQVSYSAAQLGDRLVTFVDQLLN